MTIAPDPGDSAHQSEDSLTRYLISQASSVNEQNEGEEEEECKEDECTQEKEVFT